MSTDNPYESPQASLQSDSNTTVFDESSPYKASGRFGRLAFLAYSLGYYLLSVLVIAVISGITGVLNATVIFGILTLAVYVALIYLGFVFLIRRLHDLNWSGWLSIVSLIPLVNLVIYIPALFFRGTEGANDYGPPRRYVKYHGIAVIILFVMVIGVLAAVAVPQYQEYVRRAQEAGMSQQQ